LPSSAAPPPPKPPRLAPLDAGFAPIPPFLNDFAVVFTFTNV